MHHPSALRNRGLILAELQALLGADATGYALEVASGSGAHMEVYAAGLPGIQWLPSEYCPLDADLPALGTGRRGGHSKLEALNTVGCDVFPNVSPAVALDASLPFEQWPIEVRSRRAGFALVVASNVAQSSPYAVTLGLLAGASLALADGGLLVIYGPFKVGGAFTTGNAAFFDADLRHHDTAWGYRNVEDLEEEGRNLNLTLMDKKDMPANNFLLVFCKSRSQL